MECNRDEAKRAKEIAENKFSAKDITGAKKFALKAQNLYPGLDGISQFLAILDVYVAAENKVNGLLDIYGILGLNPSADDDTAKKHYRKLVLSLHPDKNKSIGAEGAFQFVSEAWTIFSDKEKRSIYDQKRNVKQQRVYFQNGQKVHFQNGGSRAPKKPQTKAKGSKTEAGPTQTGSTTTGAGPSSNNNNKQMMPKTFWTVCKRCKLMYEFVRMYLNRNLLCPTCHGPFHATEMPPPNTNGSSKNTNGSNPETCKTAGVDFTSTQFSKLKRDREEAHEKEDTLRKKIPKKEAKLPSKTKQDNNNNNNGFHENTTQKGSIEVKNDVSNTGVTKNQLIKKATIEIKRKLNEWTVNDSSSVADVADETEPLVTDVQDPEFYDFDSDRSEKCFKEGQVWAGYDDHDGMPRLCALIKKVIMLNPFKMKVRWFNPKSNNNPGRVHGFFGEFKPGKAEIVSAPNYFSHKVSFSKLTSGNIRVFPRKGDVCARYTNDEFEIVEVDAYNEETGITVTPLVKVSGFKTVFHRHLDPKETRVILENEISHGIPSCVLMGEETAKAPKGCVELDPAAVPPQFLEEKMNETENINVEDDETLNKD